MLRAFSDLSKHVKLKNKLAIIDNNLFRLHYRVTFLLLLGATVMVCSRQYIGEHIRCVYDDKTLSNVIETFCFFTSTFTVVRHNNISSETTMPHPGIGPENVNEKITTHAYYQWVPFVLFGQALMFYIPHFIWKHLEGGRILGLVQGFENSALALRETALKLKGKTLPSRAEYEDKLANVRKAFLDRLKINEYWATGLVFCEFLNVINLIVQIYFTNVFLRGAFLGLGLRVLESYDIDESDPLDITFPKLTKCTFRKYGPGGSIQKHDCLCVMALNIVNEKVYMFFWYWMVIMVVATALGLIWRLLTVIMHSRSQMFNRFVFRTIVDRNSLKTITTRCNFSNWLLLYYIGKSMDSFVFRELIKGLAFEMEEDKTATSDNGEAEKLFGKSE